MPQPNPFLTRPTQATPEDLTNFLNAAPDAPEYAPVPAGTYRCRIAGGEMTTTRRGTPSYKITFVVRDGEHAGRRLWKDCCFTPDAAGYTKRDLAKLGITDGPGVYRPLRRDLLADVDVVLRCSDDNTEYNQIRDFRMAGHEPPDPFAPTRGPDAAAPAEPACDVSPGASVDTAALLAAAPRVIEEYRSRLETAATEGSDRPADAPAETAP